MVPYDVIRRKRDGEELPPDVIKEFVSSYVGGGVPDYQMSAFLMAVYFRGMTPTETLALTEAYIESGEKLDFSDIPMPKADKHSTGGVGDKVSLVLAPLVAACGVAVPMISGRGLGHTGGTLDKLESIPGLRIELSIDECRRVLGEAGFFIAAQTERMVPADKKIYALRDVTATVESIPLIVASIMSKKLSEGTDALVLDVKFGNGAFMKKLSDARRLAEAMVDVGKRYGVKTSALLTDMNQPLGRCVGNALEVEEAILYLRGDDRPDDLHEITFALGAEMLVLAGVAGSEDAAKLSLRKALDSGDALERFARFVEAQGGKPGVVEDLALLPRTPHTAVAAAKNDGWIAGFDTYGIGMLGVELGAGRKKVGERIDHAVGFKFHKKVGDEVSRGEAVATVFARDEEQARWAADRLTELVTISETPVSPPVLLGEKVA